MIRLPKCSAVITSDLHATRRTNQYKAILCQVLAEIAGIHLATQHHALAVAAHQAGTVKIKIQSIVGASPVCNNVPQFGHEFRVPIKLEEMVSQMIAKRPAIVVGAIEHIVWVLVLGSGQIQRAPRQKWVAAQARDEPLNLYVVERLAI